MIEGKWFHTYDAEDQIQHQGKFLKHLHGDLYLVNLFSWVDGECTGEYVISISSLVKNMIRVFESDNEMRNATYE